MVLADTQAERVNLIIDRKIELIPNINTIQGVISLEPIFP